MFYVPNKNQYPKEKCSLKFLNKLEEHFRTKKMAEQSFSIESTKSHKKRFKTLIDQV